MTVDQDITDEIAAAPGTESTIPSPGEVAAGAHPARQGTTFETLALCGFVFGLFAMVAALFAVGLAARAVDEGGSGSSVDGAAAVDSVALGDFFIDPADATVDTGAVLTVENEGAVEHNLAVEGAASEMLAPGATGTLDLAGVAPGTYTWTCEVPGHEAAGMTGTVTVR